MTTRMILRGGALGGASALALAALHLPAAAGTTATIQMTATAPSVCKFGSGAGTTSLLWPVVISVKSANYTATINGGASVNATVFCNNAALKLRVAAPTASCKQQGNNKAFTRNYAVVVKEGGAPVGSFTSPASNSVVANPPLTARTYTISIDPKLPKQPDSPSGTCTPANVVLSLVT